jgi:putative ABC transport system permease protein
VAFAAEERTKEIGIRKILGSSIFSIFLLLTQDFIKLILISIVVASVPTYFFMQQWLQDFAYRTDISSILFINAGLITVLLVLITVSWQAIRAATVNPVEALRYE